MKIAKRILFSVLLVFVLAAGTLFVIALAYENEVKDYMIRKLNEHLKTKVIVDSKNIQLSLLKNFPYASLNFKNISVTGSITTSVRTIKGVKKGNDPGKMSDTLLRAENISLEFNIMDLLRKNYVVKKIKTENGKVMLRMAADGSVNWDVWKGSGDTTSAKEESIFNLEKFQIVNMDLVYRDNKNNNDISCVIHKGSIGGKFTSKKYDLAVDGEIFMHHFNLDSINYLNGQSVRLDLNLDVDNDSKEYKFSDAVVFVSDLKVLVEGKYIDSKPSRFADIYLKGKDMDIQSVLSLLPEKYHKHIKDYDSDGKFYCNAHIHGKWDDVSSPEVKADFGITKADITQLSSGIVLKDAHILGNYFSSTTKSFIELQNFSASFEHGTLSGNLRLDNFSSPYLNLMVRSDLPLEDVRHLLKIDTLWNFPVDKLSGMMKINMEYKGHLNNNGKYRKSDFEQMNLAGDATLENAGMKIKNSRLAFDSINGSFVLNDNDIEVNSFSGRTARSDFYLKGLLKNILAYILTDDAGIDVETTFQSNRLDLDEFLLNQQASTRRDTVYKIKFSPQLSLTFNSNIGRLSFRKFEAANVHGIFQLRNRKLIADPISFSTMDGDVTASGMIDNSTDSTLLISCDANLNKLNISKLFFQFGDFGQRTITHNHLRGVGTATVQFASVWKSDLTVDPGRIYVRSNLSVDKGELVNFEPMKALSKYIAVSELEDIKFSSLQNQIEIKERKIIIPKMDIQSSALNLTMSGSHTFNNEIDYHFKLLLSDLLAKEARKAKKENDEFGVVEDDKSGKTNLFISMTGTVDKPIIKYDKQGAKQNLKQNISEEKQTLKQILRDEFKWFKKDTALNKKEKPKQDGKFIIKWDEEEKDKSKKEDDDY